jgi:hypothetical protein
MDVLGELAVALLLFVGLFLSWTKAIISVVIAVFIRHRVASLIAVLMAGAIEGLVGSRLELLDLYLTRDGWAAIDALTMITIALSALASLAWWCIVRTVDALVRHILRPAVPR